jgi:hypothetical protein
MAAKRTITSANSVFTLVVPDVFPVPQTLAGYAVDDAFDSDDVEASEAMMGVDGLLSAGFTPFITVQKVHFMADSPSILLFDAWLGAEEAAQEVFFAQATIYLPSVGKGYTFTNGVLTNARKLPDAKKVLQAQSYTIKWESVNPAAL